ncbi:MAG: FAD-dependent oxidoreductase [Nitrososphaerota archaeon]
MADRFDVIVVGAGPAGCAAAATLAREGVDVIMIEKTQLPGQRNVTGGVLFGKFVDGLSMIDLFPDFEGEAPLERKVTTHQLLVLGEPAKNDGSMVYRYLKLDKNSLVTKLGLTKLDIDTGHDYTVLRARLDRWMAFKAVEEGAMLALSKTVEELVWHDGRVVGVRTPDEEVYADLVIDCSGVTSNLPAQAGIRRKLEPFQVYHGIKHVYKLRSERVEELFSDAGGFRVYYLLGRFMHDMLGGGFIYPNKDTVSVGLVLDLASAVSHFTKIPLDIGKPLDMLEEMERHPFVAEILEGATRVEYSAHNIPKGYKCLPDRPYAPGFLMAGDALGVFVKIGALIDGMRPAIASGILAARAYLQAKKAGDFSAVKLSMYRTLLEPLYRSVSLSKRSSYILENRFFYKTAPTIGFGLGLGGRRIFSGGIPTPDGRDAIQRIQERTGLLDYNEDKMRAHIQVDFEKASRDRLKAWIPLCPVNCYTLITSKGVFASFRDLLNYNIAIVKRARGGDDGKILDEAIRLTREDIASGSLKFDHVACVACGTCGVIGPEEIVRFGHEYWGRGVRFWYG